MSVTFEGKEAEGVVLVGAHGIRSGIHHAIVPQLGLALMALDNLTPNQTGVELKYTKGDQHPLAMMLGMAPTEMGEFDVYNIGHNEAIEGDAVFILGESDGERILAWGDAEGLEKMTENPSSGVIVALPVEQYSDLIQLGKDLAEMTFPVEDDSEDAE